MHQWNDGGKDASSSGKMPAVLTLKSRTMWSGARTLHDLFQLSKVNPCSGDLMALDGEDLEKLAKTLDGLQLVVMDEISMVSRKMLADVDRRLNEWRTFRKRKKKRREQKVFFHPPSRPPPVFLPYIY